MKLTTAERVRRFSKQMLGLLLAVGILASSTQAAQAAPATFSYLTHMTGNSTWTAPDTGWYRVYAYGKGGNGGTGGNYYWPGNKDSTRVALAFLGAAGGAGGYVAHQVYLKKGQSLSIAINSAQTKVTGPSTNLLAGGGGDGPVLGQETGATGSMYPRPDTGVVQGGAGGTASGGNLANTPGANGAKGYCAYNDRYREFMDYFQYTEIYTTIKHNNGSTTPGPYGNSTAAIGGYMTRLQAGESRSLTGYTGFGASGAGGGRGYIYDPSDDDDNDYGQRNRRSDGGTGAPGGVVIEALRPLAGDHTTILLENKTAGRATSVKIAAYTAAADNIWGTGGGLKVSATSGSTLTLTTPTGAPEPGLQGYRWVKPAGSYALTYETGLGAGSPLTAAAGDYIIVSGWYRSSSALASGNITTQLYSGAAAAPVTLVASQSTFKPSALWERFYFIYKATSAISNLEIKGPGINFPQALTVDLNGLVWQVIPGAAGWTTGLETKKWAWGERDAAYFATQGTFFAGDTFDVSGNNGWLSVYARTLDGKTKVEQIYIDNVITDTVPPTTPVVTANPEGWTNQPVTVTVSSTDDNTGVAKLQYSDDGSRWVDMTVTGGTAQYTFPAANRNQLYYFRAIDGGDNISGTSSRYIQQDIVPPTIAPVDVPQEWTAGDKTVTLQGTDNGGSGLARYAVGTGTTPTAWQESPTFELPAGNYRAWLQDAAGNVSGNYQFTVAQIDKDAPVVSSVYVPYGWAQTSTVSITASDYASGMQDYAISTDSTDPGEAWQSSSSFTLTDNGTFYAFARDKVGNVSSPREFVVSQVDTVAPSVTPVEVPQGWAAKKDIQIIATDEGSGIKEYSISFADTTPTEGWQTSNAFTMTRDGTYYAFVRDRAGNVSPGIEFLVEQVDTEKPIINTVQLPEEWGQTLTVEIEAEDTGSGLASYAISQYSFVPASGWQDSPTFVVSKNGDYYAFAKDAVGHVSDAVKFTVDRVDGEKPVITKVTLPEAWCITGVLTIEATDNTGMVQDYAISTSSTEPTEGWQTDPSFTITENGTYYAFARDHVGNISSARYCYITKIDSVVPEIASITYSTDNTTITVRGRDNASGVAHIYMDDVKYDGSYASVDLAEDAKYIRIVVEDVAGNRSQEVTERVPGWYDELETLTILPVEFTENNQQATITAVSSDSTPIKGIYVGEKLRTGNPVTVLVSAGTQYLKLQALDVNGDRSILYEVRVPGWNTVVQSLSIADIQFSEDNSTVRITAVESGGRGLRGIRVNGELFPDNPLEYEIPHGVRHLEIQAEDNFGDRSAMVKRRVPGWSEVVTTLAITDVTFLDYNKTAKITATATGGDSVDGIYVNEVYFEGNPVVYQVPKDTEVLHIQAVSPSGDRSPMVNKQVPIDLSKSTLKLYIENPGWTSSSKAKVKITAEDVHQITKVMVRTSEQPEWTDITATRYITITADTTVFASVQNEKGETREVNEYIECFDKTAPTVTAARDRNTLNIRASDDKSGVAKILVNNREYIDVEDGKLTWQIPSGTALVTVIAEDAAGNVSRAVDVPLQTLVSAAPIIAPPQPSPEPELGPEEITMPSPEPEPEPEADPEPLPVDSPQPEPEESPTSPVPQLAAAAAGVGTTGLGGAWYYFRKKLLSKPEEMLEALKGKFRYDESEFGGAIDPLDKPEPK